MSVPTILYLNANPGDQTKWRKLAGIRRYAEAARWRVVTIDHAHSRRRSIPALVARLRPIGCIYDCDGTAETLPPSLFDDVPVVFANPKPSWHDDAACRVCVDDAAVAEAAFRELSAGIPSAYAVVAFHCPSALSAGRVSTFQDFAAWSDIRIEVFRQCVAKAGRECAVFRAKSGESRKGEMERLRPFISSLPSKTAIYAVNDEAAFAVAAAARASQRSIPRELTLLGTDNYTALCEGAQPPLSSIQLDFERMGYLAAKMLGEKISHRDTETQSDKIVIRAQRQSSTENLLCGSVALCDPKCLTIGPLLAVRRESTGGYGRREPHVLEAVEIIRREACNGLSVAELSGRLPGSRRLLDLRFREAMGHSIHEEILQVRLERVFDLLRRLDVRIGAVADFSGFALHQLEKVFRIRFGCSLREWRRRNVQP